MSSAIFPPNCLGGDELRLYLFMETVTWRMCSFHEYGGIFRFTNDFTICSNNIQDDGPSWKSTKQVKSVFTFATVQ